MKFHRLLPLILFFSTITLALSQKPDFDPSFRGTWKLNLDRSDFGGSEKLKSGTVRWTEHGWVFAIVLPNGEIYADGVSLDHGCTLIGVESGITCELRTLSPQHVRLTTMQNGKALRVGDIELVDKNTTKTTHRVSPEK